MKRICCISFLLFSVTLIQSQDIILKINGDEIEATVTEIGLETIKSTRFGNPDGPEYVILKEDVFMIRYKNGDSELFTVCTDLVGDYQETNNQFQSANEPYVNSYYQNQNNKYFSIGQGFGVSYGGVGVRAQARFGGLPALVSIGV